MRHVAHIVQLGRAHFIEVTGIRTVNEGNTARVEFAWNYTSEPIWDELIKAGWNVAPASKIRSGEAVFQLYDDGWRLTALSLDG